MLSPLLHNFVSYAGAAVVFLLAFSTRTDTGGGTQFSTAQLGALMWTAHFLRRTLETVVVFKFSGDKIDISDSIVEFIYYWAFGAWIAVSLDSEMWLSAGWLSDSAQEPSLMGAVGLACWGLCEVANMGCHLTLRDLKAPNKPRSYPAGGNFLFSMVACPHYFFEISSWIAFNIATGFPVSSSLFCCVGGIIMACYAVEKHEAYKSKYKDYPLSRTPIMPFMDIRPPQFLITALGRGQ